MVHIVRQPPLLVQSIYLQIYRHTEAYSHRKRKKVKTITPLPNGATWVTFKDFSCLRLLDITPENNYVYFAAGSDSLRNCKKIHVITYDSEGNEWILTDSGAINWSRSQQIPGNFHHIYKMAGYTILATSNGAITKIDTQGDTENYTTLASKGVKVTYMLHTGNRLIAATDRGVWSINISDGNLLHYTSLPAIYLFQDSSHRIWAFGKDNTVALIPNITKEEVLLLTTAFAPTSEPMRNPQLIFEDNRNNIILKPSEGVLSYYDEASNTLKECRFYDDDDKTEIYAPNTIKNTLSTTTRTCGYFGQEVSTVSVSGLTFSPTGKTDTNRRHVLYYPTHQAEDGLPIAPTSSP